MNKLNFKIISLSALLVVFLLSFSPVSGRNINIAGLVVNAATLLPIQAANVYDAENRIVGTTDENGYFKITINYEKPGAINFKFKIKKEGFESFSQRENWGDLSNNTNAVEYFGLRQLKSEIKPFSDLVEHSGSLNYYDVLSGFTKIKAQKDFDDKLTKAKAGNENVLFNIDGSFYIADKTGWIKIDSDDDLITVNNKQTLAAKQLNARIKRRDVKSMTPVEAKREKYAVYTK